MAERLASSQRIAALYALVTHPEPLRRTDVVENIAEGLDLDTNAAWTAWLCTCVQGVMASVVAGTVWHMSEAQMATLEGLVLQQLRQTIADEAYDEWVAEGRQVLKRASHG